MDRLEAVARIRQRAVHDGGERVGEIALFQRLAQRNVLHVARVFRGNHFGCHGMPGLARLQTSNKGRNEPISARNTAESIVLSAPRS